MLFEVWQHHLATALLHNSDDIQNALRGPNVLLEVHGLIDTSEHVE